MNNKRFSAFEGLRVIATLGIFLFHAGFLNNGSFFVTFFFMLSGFLCYFTKNNSMQMYTFISWLKKYVWGKIKQFYPLYFFTFVLAFFVREIYQYIFSLDGLFQVILNLLMLKPFFSDYAYSFNPLSWFLAVTFFLYIIGYFLIKVLNRINSIIFIIINIMSVMLIIILINYAADIVHFSIYTFPIYRILDFYLGMLSAKLFIQIKINCNFSVIELLTVIILFLQYVFDSNIKINPGYNSIILFFVLYIFAFGNGIISKILSIDFFISTAKYCFEFYMIHELMLMIFRKIYLDENLNENFRLILISFPALLITIVLSVGFKTIQREIIKNKNFTFRGV